MDADASAPPEPLLVVLVSLGGACGALTRYAVLERLGTASTADPGSVWTTLVVNVSGCLAIGVLLGLAGHRPRVRAFAGVGFLGGYTTFSAYAAGVADLLHRPALGLGYAVGTVVAAVAAVAAGLVLARVLARVLRSGRR